MVQYNQPDIEKPIFTIDEIGQTIPQHDVSGRHKDVVEVAQAAIRGGAGVLQMVMMPVPGRAGNKTSGAHHVGKDMREALREVIKANEVIGVGVELPTSLSNVTGWVPQQNRLDEQTRKDHLDEIKAAIRFTGDVFEGGGTDIVSFEFARRFHDAKWNQEDRFKMQKHRDEETSSSIRFITGDGEIKQFNQKATMYLKRKPGTDETDEEGNFHPWEWKDFIKLAESKGEGVDTIDTAHKLFKEALHEKELSETEAKISKQEIELKQFRDKVGYDFISRQDPDTLSDAQRGQIDYVQDQQKNLDQLKRSKLELNDQLGRWKTFSTHAKQKVWESYAELGIYAMEDENSRTTAMRDHLYVGPEIGWPEYYGGHPDEFIEIITESRKVMAKKLMDKGMKKKDAEKQASEHIRGTFDTGHLGMWLKHFDLDESNDKKREKKFKEWYLEKVEAIAKSDVVGNVQLVDSHGGEHAHLPPGQGIFPLKEAMEIMKQTAPREFHIISEGHEEERQESGRIRTQAWRLLDARIGRDPDSPTWTQVSDKFKYQLTSPKMMFGNNAPPFGDYRPWSDIPFE